MSRARAFNDRPKWLIKQFHRESKMAKFSSIHSLNNVRIVLVDRVVETGHIIIESGRIASIGIGDNAPLPSEGLDLRGATVFPGFIDAHIHGAVDVDVMNASVEALAEVSYFLATQGVTSWLPTLVPASDEEYDRSVSTIHQASGRPVTGARIVGVHYEGPFVNPAQCGALHSAHFKTFHGAEDLESLRTPPRVVKMITLAPEIEGGIELVKELHRRGWIISIGHTRAEAEVLDEAIAGGARHMTHFMNAMPPLHHRKPGPVGWGLSRDDVTCDVIADGIHVDPLVLRLLLKVKGTQGLCLISDAIAAAGRGDGAYHIWGETISVKNGRTSNASGNIAGSVATMFDAVKLIGTLGVSEVEIAELASLNPARLLRLDSECGSIEEGKQADLVAFDEDGNVQLTIVGGEIVYER